MPLFSNLCIAQERNVTTWRFADAGLYHGHSIAPATYISANTSVSAQVYGYIAAGNRIDTMTLANDSVNILTIAQDGLPATGYPAFTTAVGSPGFNFGATGISDLRATKMVPFLPNSLSTVPDFALVCQARPGGGSQDGILVSLMSVSQFGNAPTVYNTVTLMDGQQGNLYPTYALWDSGNTLFICGFATPMGAFSAYGLGSTPDMTTDKQAFIASVDLHSMMANIAYYNTQQNLTHPPPLYDVYAPIFNDYDAALRMRMIEGHLLVTGSGNGTDTTSYPLAPAWPVNASHTWIAEIDPSTLSVISQDYFGLGSDVQAFAYPFLEFGLCGVDVGQDSAGARSYFVFQNQLEIGAYYASHVDSATLKLSMPTTMQNTVYFYDSNLVFRIYGATPLSVPQTTQFKNYTIYGVLHATGTFATTWDLHYSGLTGTRVSVGD